MLGWVIAAVTNGTYEDWVERRIFQPLGMTRSGFKLTPAVLQRMARGFNGYAPGEPVVPTEMGQQAPAGGAYSSGRWG